MPSGREYFDAIARGGLPAALDLGLGAGRAQGDTQPERGNPTPETADKDTKTLGGVNVTTIALVVVGVVAVAGLVYFIARR